MTNAEFNNYVFDQLRDRYEDSIFASHILMNKSKMIDKIIDRATIDSPLFWSWTNDTDEEILGFESGTKYCFTTLCLN